MDGWMNEIEEDQVQSAIRSTLSQIQKDLLQLASTKDPSVQEFGTTFLASVLWGGDNLTVANGLKYNPIAFTIKETVTH